MLRFVVARLDFGRARALVTPGGPVANYDTAGGGWNVVLIDIGYNIHYTLHTHRRNIGIFV